MDRQVTRENFETWNEEMIHRFDPDAYHNHPSPIVRLIEGRRVREILQLLDVAQDQRILEVGCGAGNILERIAGGELHGIDLSDYILEKARRRLGERAVLQKADAEDLPYDDQTFDRVFCSEVLEHVLDPSAVLAEMRRVTRTDGVVVVSVPNEALINTLKKFVFKTGPLGRWLLQSNAGGYTSATRMTDEWHLHSFDPSLLRKLASDHFEVQQISSIPFRGLPLRLVAKLRPQTMAEA